MSQGDRSILKVPWTMPQLYARAMYHPLKGCNTDRVGATTFSGPVKRDVDWLRR